MPTHGAPSTARITSPAFNPACAAGVFSPTYWTLKPDPLRRMRRPERSARSGSAAK
eukprot:gene21043-15545_t